MHAFHLRTTEPVNAAQLADELRTVPGFREAHCRGQSVRVELEDAGQLAHVTKMIEEHTPDPDYSPDANPHAVAEFLSLLNPSQHDIIQVVRALCLATGAKPKARSMGLDVTTLRPGQHLATDSACGVVVGAYWFTSLVELQIRVIRYTCGDVPILVCDDCSPDGRQEAMQAICQRYGVDFRGAKERLGHVPGDLAAYAHGLLWAAKKGLRVLAKVSQRWICLPSRWLQEGAELLLASGLPLASNQCKVGRYPVRSEAGLLDVPAWSQRGAIELLLDARKNRGLLTAEQILGRILDYQLGGELASWPLLGQLRQRRYPGSLWHDANTEKEYRQLAGFFGVDLGQEFSCCTSDHIPGYKG